MNSSYDEVLHASTSTWRFQRLELVLEFSRKKIVPLNIPVLCIRSIVAMLPRFHSLYTFWNDSWINSDLNRLLKAFPLTPNVLDYDDMHSDDDKMAALFNDIHGERSWITSLNHQLEAHPVAEENLVTQRADFIRDCAELAMAMCDKMVHSRKKEDAHTSDLQALEGAGRQHLSTTDLEICGLKKQFASEISATRDEVRSARAREQQLEAELANIRAQNEKLERALLSERRQHSEPRKQPAAKTRLLPLPKDTHI